MAGAVLSETNISSNNNTCQAHAQLNYVRSTVTNANEKIVLPALKRGIRQCFFFMLIYFCVFILELCVYDGRWLHLRDDRRM